MKKIVFILLIFISLLASCTSIGSSGDVQVFFIEKGKLQYFFPPSDWDFPDKSYDFNGDWLFRSYTLEGESQSRTILNFTLGYDKLKNGKMTLDSIYLLSDGGKKTECHDIQLLFKDHEKDRYTSWFSSSEFYDFMMNNENPRLLLQLDGIEYQLDPSGRFKKHHLYFQKVQPDYN